jgi:hypothetical protein
MPINPTPNFPLHQLGLTVTVAAAIVFTTTISTAQEQKKRWPTAGGTAAEQTDWRKSGTPAKIDVDFAGGTLADYVKMIRESSKKANIVVSKNAEKTVLPQITINGVEVETAIMILEKLNLDLDIDRSDSVIVINARAVKDSITVVNITPILAEHPRETLLTAITEGLELIGSNPDQVALKMHRDTGLLFIRGTLRETSLVSDIVNQLSPRENIRWPNKGGGRGMSGGGPGAGVGGGAPGAGTGRGRRGGGGEVGSPNKKPKGKNKGDR